MTALARPMAAIAALGLLAACGSDPAPQNDSALSPTEAEAALDDAINATDEAGNGTDTVAGTLVPPAPGEPGGLPDDRRPLDESAARDPGSVAASGSVIERWGLALGEGRYGEAWRLWADDGRRSGMSEAQFADAYRRYSEIHVLVGRPEAAQAQTVRVPVQLYGRLRESGRPFNLIGTMTLARNPQARQGDTSRPHWLIAGSGLRPEGTVRVVPAGTETMSMRIPVAFRGRWSASPGRCGAPGDDMRLAVAPDQLVFYESVGTVTAVESLSPRAIRVDARFSGEGETWRDSHVLTLSDSGDALAIGDVRRVRCAT